MESRRRQQEQPGRLIHPGTRDVLVGQLAESLHRGHWRLAIRRFLVLKAYEFEIPDAHEQTVRRLISSRTADDLRKIRRQVRSWIDMRAMQPPDWVALGTPVDKIECLHAISRRRAPDAACSSG